MGADLFGSYVATVLAAMVLGNYVIRDYVEANGTAFVDNFSGMGPVILPIVIAGVGIIASIIGTFLVRTNKSDASEADVQRVLNLGNWSAIIITAVVTFFLIIWMLPLTIYMDFFSERILEVASINVFYASLIGLAVGGLISAITEYYTGTGKKPVMNIIKNSSTGAATNIIAGLATGMMSTFLSILLLDRKSTRLNSSHVAISYA